jgi:hypothetical protein
VIFVTGYSKQKSVLDQFHLGSLDPLLDPEKGLSSPPLAPHNQQFNRQYKHFLLHCSFKDVAV